MTPDSPFAPVHSRESFFESAAIADALRRLGDGLGAREPFVLVTGEPGTGKSALVAHAIAQWGARVTTAFVAYPALTGAELLEEIHRRFGAEPAEGASRSRLVAGIERALASAAERAQVAVVVVDDAHRLAPELLEELRLLANAARQAGCAFEVVLVGLPALEAAFDGAELATLRQRVSVRVRLEALSAADTQRYVHHRVNAAGGDGPGLFSRKTCREIATLAHGVPRQIGSLAAEALRLAHAANAPTVEPAHVRAAAAALWGAAAVAASTPRAPKAEAETPQPPHAGAEPEAEVAAPAASASPAASESPAASPTAVTRAPSSAPRATQPAPPAVPPPPAAPAPAAPRATRPAPSAFVPDPPPVVPAAHDPREWVARFIGDQGPVQIGSQSFADASFDADASGSEHESAHASLPAQPSPRKRSRAAHGPQRRGRGRGMRAASSVAIASLVVVGVVAVVLRANRGAHGADRAASAANAAPTRATAAPAASLPNASTRLVVAQRPAPATVVRPAAKDSAAVRTRYTVDVGGYLDLDRAYEQRDRLRAATGIDAWVVPTWESGGETHRVVLGIYRTPERATAAAGEFLATNTAPEATVIPLPKRSLRR